MRLEPTERRFQGSDATIAYFEWAGAPEQPTLLLVHATGFHARVWDGLVRALPDKWHVIAVELRGHGRSSKEGPFDQWSHFGGDVVELIDHLGLESAVAAGHSMGGWVLCHAALARPNAFRQLVLIDPVLNAPEFYEENRYPDMQGPEDHPAARRRSKWTHWQELYERLKDREPYSLWHPKVLEDYCRHGLLPHPTGDGHVLACPPIVEASVYFNSWKAYLHDRLGEIETPVTILRARRRQLPAVGETDYAGSPTWERIADLFQQAEDVSLPEYTHFLPMQNPALVARYISGTDHSLTS